MKKDWQNIEIGAPVIIQYLLENCAGNKKKKLWEDFSNHGITISTKYLDTLLNEELCDPDTRLIEEIGSAYFIPSKFFFYKSLAREFTKYSMFEEKVWCNFIINTKSFVTDCFVRNSGNNEKTCTDLGLKDSSLEKFIGFTKKSELPRLSVKRYIYLHKQQSISEYAYIEDPNYCVKESDLDSLKVNELYSKYVREDFPFKVTDERFIQERQKDYVKDKLKEDHYGY